MKHFSSIIIWSAFSATIFVYFSVAAKIISMSEDSIVSNIVKGLEIPEQSIYLLVFGIIALITGSVIKSR